MGSLAAWVHDIDPFAVRFTGAAGVRWYGLAYVGGVVGGWLVLRRAAAKQLAAIGPQAVDELLIGLIIGVFAGGRLGYVLFYEPSLLGSFSSGAPWWDALAINRGGMASHGGMLGVLAAAWWFARKNRVPFLHVVDLAAIVAPIGLCFGRLANFVNGELLGGIVAPPGKPAPGWAVKFPQELLTRHRPELDAAQQAGLETLLRTNAPTAWLHEGPGAAIKAVIAKVQGGEEDIAEQLGALLAARHPSQLYQAAGEGVLVGVAMLVVWAKPRRPGVVTAWFLLVYGAVRVLTEAAWRLPDDRFDVGRPGGLSRGQWLSVAMLVGGAWLLWWTAKHGAARTGGWLVRSCPSTPPEQQACPGAGRRGG